MKGEITMSKAKEMIHPVHAEVWYTMALNVQEVMEGFDTTQTDVPTILKDITERLNKTGYQVLKDYNDKTYEYFDFEVWTSNDDGRYGLRLFFGHKWFDKIYLHNLQGMYLYAPQDQYDVLDDVTIDELKEAANDNR